VIFYVCFIVEKFQHQLVVKYHQLKMNGVFNMLELCIILLVIGILAIVLELIMPGFDSFVSGIIGILALVASAVLAVIFVPGGWFFVVINTTVLGLAVFFLLTFIKRKQFHGRIILTENLSEDLPVIDLTGLVGKEGKTVTILRPYGEADFNGVRVEVCASASMIERGARVKVVETQANKVIVSEVDGN
jgi:membrane-bound serine protease (ClpP class)